MSVAEIAKDAGRESNADCSPGSLARSTSVRSFVPFRLRLRPSGAVEAAASSSPPSCSARVAVASLEVLG